MDTTTARRASLLGIPVDPITMNDAVTRFRDLVKTGGPAVAFSLNVDIWMKLRRDRVLRDIYEKAELVLVDGTPMVWAAHLLRVPLPGRVSGSDLLPRFCEIAAKEGYRIFFLGALPGVAARAKSALEAQYPGLCVVGTYSPPLHFERDPLEDSKTVEIVKSAAPDVLFVGFGCPRQELWLSRHVGNLGVPISMGVGSAIDFASGRLRRAPLVVQRLGFEWVYRLIQEPRRLWKRYLLDDTPFVYYVAREWIRLVLMGRVSPF